MRYKAASFLPPENYDTKKIAEKLGLKEGANVCPHRSDTKPSCSLFQSDSGEFLLYDHAYNKVISLTDLANHLGADISDCLNSGGRKPRGASSKVSLSVTIEEWSAPTLEYWRRHHISVETLTMFSVSPVKAVYKDLDAVKLDGPTYCYQVEGGRIKIYSPLSRTLKWFGNSKVDDLHPLWSLRSKKKHVIICSSIKDAMVLYECGFNAVAFGSETLSLKKCSQKLNLLKGIFQRVYVLFDADDTGLKASTKLCKEFSFINLTPTFASKMRAYSVKDPAELILSVGKKKTARILKKILAKST